MDSTVVLLYVLTAVCLFYIAGDYDRVVENTLGVL